MIGRAFARHHQQFTLIHINLFQAKLVKITKRTWINELYCAIIKQIITMVSSSLIIFNFLQVHKLVETHNALKDK